MSDNKKELRRIFAERMLSEPFEMLDSCNEGIAMNLTDIGELTRADTVFVYWSTPREPDTHRLVSSFLRQGKRVALPYIIGPGIMEAREIRSVKELKAGAFDIMAPPDSAVTVLPEDIDAAIVPAMAFDRSGYRLGRGGGYYDRYLAGLGAYTIGIVPSFCLVDRLERQEHDVSVCCVVTEREILRLG